MKEFLRQRSLDVKTEVEPLTELMSNNIQSMLNTMRGSPLLTEAIRG